MCRSRSSSRISCSLPALTCRSRSSRSGRPEPDLNIYDFMVTGGANNASQFSNPTVDAQLKVARAESDEAKRKAAYDQVMQVLNDEVPYVYLYHQNNVFAMSAQITGYKYVADGIIRAANMSKK